MTQLVYSYVRPGFQRNHSRAVFLDRDGVLIEDTGYVHRIEDVNFIPGAMEAVGELNRSGFAVVLVTNQAGIGRGRFTWADFENVQQCIDYKLSEVSAYLDGIWACAAHPDGLKDYRHSSHPWRKPNPGMLRHAATQMGLEVSESWLVGDKALDVEAGIRANLHGICHVATGYGKQMQTEVEDLRRQHPTMQVVSCATVREAADVIIRSTKNSAVPQLDSEPHL